MIFFLIPVYNESLNLIGLIHNLQNTLPDYPKYYVFVDDYSTDNSIEIIKKNFSSDNFKILNNEVNQGPGYCFNKGFEWVLLNSKDPADLIVTIEADNTSDLNILIDMVKISELGYDLVLASVYAQGGGFDKTSFFRKLFSHIANLLFRFLFNIKVLTLSSFYRVYKISLIKAIKNNHKEIISEKGFICMLEILLKAVKYNAKIIEVPMVLYSTKRKGKSKMKVVKTGLQYLSFLIRSQK